MTNDEREIQDFEAWYTLEWNKGDCPYSIIEPETKDFGQCAWLERGRRDRERIEGFEKLIKALQQVGAAYRTGTNPPEWVFETIDQARKDGLI